MDMVTDNDGQKEVGGGSIGSYGNSFTAGDIIGISYGFG